MALFLYGMRPLIAAGPVVHAERPYYVDEPSEVLQQLQLESIVNLKKEKKSAERI